MQGALIHDLGVVTVVAAATAMLARQLGQPTILGYLLAGLIVGPYIPVPLFADPARMGELAEVGVVLVMFAVGLEFRARKLLEIIPISGFTAAIQIGALAWAGFSVGSFMGWTTVSSVCLGATVSISSTMVVSAVLRTNPINPDIRRHVFGILIVQDVAAIVLIAVVTALAAGEDIGFRALGQLVVQLAGVVAAMLVAGLLLLPRLVRIALAKRDTEVLVVLIAGAAFGLALVAEGFGYSVALGAFLAGMAVAESGRGHEVEKAIEPLRALFSAIFFVSIGMAVDPLVAWKSMPLALGLSAVVIGMQFVSVSAGTVLTGSSVRSGIYAGLALGQVGELSFILATIAIAGGVVPKETLPALVTVATITAFTTPMLLSRAQGIVALLDRWIPDRAQQVLVAYQSFIRTIRTPREGPSLRRPATAVVLDWFALVVLFVARQAVQPHVADAQQLTLDAAAAVVAVPFVIGLVRSGSRLAANARALAQQDSAPTPRARAVEAVALLFVVVAVGLPTLAILQPLVGGHWGEVAFLSVLITVLVVLGLRLGRVDNEYTSGVARIATELADHVGTDESTPGVAPAPTPLGGLDHRPLRIETDSRADGSTLARLDLRCRTGATVVAITRGNITTSLPSGDEQIEAGDVLAVSGSPDAIERARALLDGRDR